MFKYYIRDLFTEGLGDLFYVKVVNYYRKTIKSNKLLKTVLFIHKIIYIIFLFAVAIGLFLLSYPF